MKIHNLLIALALPMMLFSGCSSEEPEPFNENYIDMLTRGEESVVYTIEELKTFNKDDNGDGAWKEFDYKELCGWSTPLSDKIYIHQGKSWDHVEMFSSAYGFHPLLFVLSAYKNKTHNDVCFYLEHEFSYDPTSKTMNIGGRKAEVVSVDETQIKLNVYSKYNGSNGLGTEKCSYVFKKENIKFPDESREFLYPSDKEAIEGMLEIFKDEFGTVFNINKYLNGMVIFPEDMFDLESKELQEQINRWCNRHHY